MPPEQDFEYTARMLKSGKDQSQPVIYIKLLEYCLRRLEEEYFAFLPSFLHE